MRYLPPPCGCRYCVVFGSDCRFPPLGQLLPNRVWLLPTIIFLALGSAVVSNKSPWCDEGWFACPAHQMAFHGPSGTPVLEPTGHYLDRRLDGIERRTLVVPPLHLVLLACWYRVWGPGLSVPRFYGLLWGFGGLLVLGALVHWTWRKRRLTLLFMLLLSVDLTYLWASADVRMDIQTATLSWASWLTYLLLRKKSVRLAAGLSNICVALAALHHPNAIYGALGLLCVFLILDRQKFDVRVLVYSTIPYLLAAAFWAYWIAPDWDLFRIQFGANLAGRASIRTRYLAKPWEMLWLEVAIRYLAAYGVRPVWLGTVPSLFQTIPFVYGAVLIVLTVQARRMTKDRTLALIVLCGTQILVFTFLMSFKAQNYLVYLAPLWDIWLARSLWTLGRRGGYPRIVAVVLAACFTIAHLTALAAKGIEAPRRTQFDAARAELSRLRAPQETLWAPTYWGVDSDFQGYKEDIRLGYHTGERRDWIVLDHWNAYYDSLFAIEEVAVGRYVYNLLEKEYRLGATFGEYRIYRRLKNQNSNQKTKEKTLDARLH